VYRERKQSYGINEIDSYKAGFISDFVTYLNIFTFHLNFAF